MSGASDRTGCADRSPRPGGSRESRADRGTVAVLACLVAGVLVAIGVRIAASGPGPGLGLVLPGLLGLAAGGGTGRDTGLEQLTTAVEELVARIDERTRRRVTAVESESRTSVDADTATESASESDPENEIRLEEGSGIRARDHVGESEGESESAGKGKNDDGNGTLADEIDHLAATIEDDDVSRLAGAIDDLAATVRDREHQLAETERYRKELYRITSATDTTTEEKIRHLLALGCERLDVEAGFVSRIDTVADHYEVRIASENDVVQEGLETDLSTVYCEETVSSDDILGIHDAATEGYAEHPNYREFGISCYLGGRIDVDDECYGTLCFVDREPHDEPFSATERTFVDLMTRWMSHEFERREHEQYKAFTDEMLDTVDDIFYVLDADGELRRWNETLADVTGYSGAEIEAMEGPMYFPSDSMEAIEESVEEAFETGETRVEVPIVTKDGERIPYEFVASTLEDPDGMPVEVGIGRDISARKRYERELERTTQLLEQGQRLAGVGSWELEVAEGTELEVAGGTDERSWADMTSEFDWTDETARIHGFSPDTDIGLEQALELYRPADRRRIRQAIERAIDDGATYDLELRLTTPQGDQRWVRTIGEPGSVSETDESTTTTTTVRGSIQDVTERKEREQQLQETTERLEAMIEASPAAIIALDTDGTVEQWNPAAERIFGWRESEVLGEPLPAVPDSRHQDHRHLLERVLAGETVTGVETRRQRKGGTVIDVSLSAAPIRDAAGTIVGVMGAVEDITDRKERERRLETTSARLEALFDNSPDIIDVLDDEGTIVEANQRFHDKLGYPDGELIGTKIWEHDTQFDADDVLALLEELSVGDRRKFEGRFERRDGSSFPVEVHLIHLDLDLEDGDESRFMAICRDVTERKTRERDLRETKRRLELALEGSNTGIWEWTVDTDDIAWNETLERMLGLEPGEFEGTYEDFRRRVHPDDVPAVEAALQEAVANSEPYQAEFQMQHADGHWIWFVARGRLVDDGGTTRMLGIVNDITQRKESERQLREREQQLQRYTAYTDDVLDAIDDVFYVLDEDYALQRWNESLAAVTGYTDAELDGMDALELVADDDRSAVRTGLDSIDELRGVPLEADVLTSDGEEIPFEFVAVPLSDPDGNPVIAGIGRDISERVEKERQLSRLISNIPGLVYRVRNEPNRPAEFVSDGVRDITGYDSAALENGAVDWGTDIERGESTWDQIQDAVDAGDPFNLTYPIETADGDRRWVKEQGRGVYADDGSVKTIEGVVIDVTERIEYERELERTTDLLERVQRMAEVGGWELDMRSEPRTAIWTDELYRLHDLPRDATPDLETTIACYHPDDRPFVREQLESAIAAEQGYEFEARIRTETGDVRWVRANGEPIYDDGELVTYRGSVRNITDQKEREQALELLNETARGLLNSETEAAVADRVVETATALLEASAAAVYLLDDETNRFEPVASTADFGDRADGAPSVAVGDSGSTLWNTYVAGSQTVVDNAMTDEQSPLFSNGTGGLLVPIGDHGVFVLTAPPASIDDETRQLFETLVATTEAAFDRLESEATLRERDAELEARNRRLRRQIAINELIRRIDQLLIGAESRDEIERAVPERLVESEDVAFAWIGTVDADGTRLEPRTWAGTGAGEAYLDTVSLAVEDAESDAEDAAGTDADPPAATPAVRTARSEQPTIVENVVDRLQQEGWRRDALDAGFQSVVTVPLTFEGYTYGVLAVYGGEPEAFTDLEQTVFAELGESIANAINAVKTQEALHAETFVELTLELSAGEDILSRIATATGAEVTYEGLGTASAEQTVLFFETSGVDADDVTTTLENLVAVTDYRLIRETNGDEREDEDGNATCLFEATVSGEVVASRLVRYGGSPRTITADGDRTTVTVDVPMGTDIREFVEMLRDHYASVELQSQRHVQRATQTRQELLAGLFEPLTDRQLEVLRTAYFAGFFEWPRESTGEEIAEMLEVTQPTVNRHLRVAQQRLLSQLFDDGAVALAGE